MDSTSLGARQRKTNTAPLPLNGSFPSGSASHRLSTWFQACSLRWTQPLSPTVTSLAAMFTVSPQRSKLNLLRPTTPATTGPACRPHRSSQAAGPRRAACIMSKAQEIAAMIASGCGSRRLPVAKNASPTVLIFSQPSPLVFNLGQVGPFLVTQVLLLQACSNTGPEQHLVERLRQVVFRPELNTVNHTIQVTYGGDK